MSIDLPFHKSWFDDNEINEVIETLKSGWLTTGPKTKRFEDDFKDYIGCGYAIGLNSCTAGLHLALATKRFKAGDEVITTTMTFPATANVIMHERLCPVLVDVEPGTLTIDVNQILEKITPKTRAIMPVHFAGHPCDMDPVMELAEKYKLLIIEDAAHALETKYKGRKIGGLGNPTAFSFYANKNITTGEGGMLTTNDESLDEMVRVMRLHGLSRDAWKRFGKSGFSQWELRLPGFKYNMADINAALGIHQLKKINNFLKIRKQYAAMYDEAFSQIPELEILEKRDYAEPSYHLYIIALRLEQLTITRDQFVDKIQSAGVGVAIHYQALHLQPLYKKKFNTRLDDYPVATSYSARILSLPLYPRMSVQDIERVSNVVADIISCNRR
ncbi:MAG: DegT/DnrJ/EryC1/StrS aminotransferase family protein [Nitrospina sp.]|jgi:dTDP-4-amino-4,6-dideoxygalactose transaminase|nr:DegT/DnrJ/EryC1/StrS aminotransferase family protein [Nitrospina sp.]MBT6601232.1 DegT/DnrJ/EryC1/StrS aminotransferase family protein [Nitrospina sp.]